MIWQAPQSAAPVAGFSIALSGLVGYLLFAVAYSGAAATVVRRSGTRALWSFAVITILLATTWFLWRLRPGFPSLARSGLLLRISLALMPAGTLLMGSWFVHRSVKRHPRASLVRHAVWGTLGFFGGLFLSLLAPFLHDVAALF